MELLLRAAQPQLHRYIVRLVWPTHADDVTQETLITIARKVTWLAEPRSLPDVAYLEH